MHLPSLKCDESMLEESLHSLPPISAAYFDICQVSFDGQGVSQLPVETILAFAEQLLGPRAFGLGACDASRPSHSWWFGAELLAA